MPGDEWQKFANLRAYFAFMWTHPGKKLLFMGGEFAQGREWNHDTSLDWHLLEQSRHRGMQILIGDLNALMQTRPALHQKDCEPVGFQWMDATDVDQSVIAYMRRGNDPADCVIVVCNFTPIVRSRYRLGVPSAGDYLELINTDADTYGGSGVGNAGCVGADRVPWHGHPYSVELTLPPLATLVLAPAQFGKR
jgi:1,4-alpha-glucan branching enzyme